MKKGRLTPFEMRVLQLLYRYETDIECNGVVFNRAADGEEILALGTVDEDPLFVAEEGGYEFSNGYYAVVSDDSLQVTETQLREVLAGLERKKLVKKLDLSRYNGEEIYLMRQQGGTFQCYTEVPKGVYAYTLSREAQDTLDLGKEDL